MSIVVDSFPTGIRQPSQYPYMDWVDGRIHKLMPGVDFTCEPRSMVLTAKAYYKRHSIPVRISRSRDEIYIQRIENGSSN